MTVSTKPAVAVKTGMRSLRSGQHCIRTLLLLLAVFAAAFANPPPDSFEMVILDSFFVHAVSRYVFGDGDHDGRTEIYVRGLDSLGEWEGQVIEHRGGNSFEVQPLGFEHAIFWALGDGDRDGRADAIVQKNGGVGLVFESRDSTTLPRDSVWRVWYPLMGTSVYGIFTDLDRDSVAEIVLTRGGDVYGVHIYENRGDNRYDSVAFLPSTPEGIPLETVQTFDLDRDGMPELFVGTDLGRALFYESTGNDTYALKSVSLIPESNNNVVGATDDIDRDGKPEAWTLGRTWSRGAILTMFEAVSDDSFAISWSFEWADDPGPGASSRDGSICAGDIDGHGSDELLVADGTMRLFRCVGNDSFESIWGLPMTGRAALHDVNRDGRAELIHMKDEHWTFIREYHGIGIAEQERRRLEAVTLSPSVVHTGSSVRLTGTEPGQTFQLLDVTGRTVRSVTESTIRTAGLAPGAYFVRIRSGNQSVTRKLLVVP